MQTDKESVTTMVQQHPDSTASLSAIGISKDFGNFRALDDINLDVEDGEFVCFLGPSGCGKTTLLRIIAGLETQTEGRIIQNGIDVSHSPPAARDFGIVFQSYALFPNLSVVKNVAYGLDATAVRRDEKNARVRELLELVGLHDQDNKYPAQLSGGQQQRVALARALATSPGLLLLDEPLSALDARVRTHLRREIKELQRRLGVTTVMVTHDQEEALTMADRIVVMNQGVIDQIGTPAEVYGAPASLFVADFIGSMNKVQARVIDANHLQIDAAQLICTAHGLAPGATATLTIRPEDIVPLEQGEQRASENTIQVTVTTMEYLGSFWRCDLHATDIPSATLQADFSANAVRRLRIATNSSLSVDLPISRVRVFEGSNLGD